MSTQQQQGLGNGRNWAAVPGETETYEWSVDPEHGLVQGPLDLEFLRGHRIHLSLAEGQIALLIQGPDLRAVYLDGGHILDIGRGDQQIPPECHLIFVATGRGLDTRWTRNAPLDLGHQTDVIGSCALGVTAPTRFYATFLAGNDTWDEAFIARVVHQTVSAAMTEILDGVADDPVRLQTRLTGLDPSELDDELAPYGLSCYRIALYTSAPPVESDSVETAGQFTPAGHN